MYLLKVEASFEAAHRLPEYNGPCRRMHGHHWVVQATYQALALGAQGMTIDLVILKKLLRAAVATYDHQSLNQIMTCTPTAENIARVIFSKLKSLEFGKALTQVAVEESPGAVVIYRAEHRE